VAALDIYAFYDPERYASGMEEQQPLRMTHALVQVAAALLESPHEQHYGYDLAQRAGVNSNALYQVLARMHERRWLEDGWEQGKPGAKGPRRRYYTITPNGMARLGALLADASRDRRFSALNLKPGLVQ
jgi:PadR family transcriptional regulator PadR